MSSFIKNITNSSLQPTEQIDKINEIIDGKQDKLTDTSNIKINLLSWVEPFEIYSYPMIYTRSSTFDGTRFIILYSLNDSDSLYSTRCTTSTDGITWHFGSSGINISSSINFHNICYGNSLYIVVDKIGNVSISNDSMATWSTPTFILNLTIDSNDEWVDIVYTGTVFVLLSKKGMYSTSTDGENWTQTNSISVPSRSDWKSLACSENKLVALSTTGYVSYTGIETFSWSNPVQIDNLTVTNSWSKITYAKDRYVAISNNGYTSTSDDGLIWEMSYYACELKNYSWQTICYGNDKIIAAPYAARQITYTSLRQSLRLNPNIRLANGHISIINRSIKKGIFPSSNAFLGGISWLDNNNTGTDSQNEIVSIQPHIDTNGNTYLSFYLKEFQDGSTTNDSFRLCYIQATENSSAVMYASIPTPPTNQNNTRVATTQFVRRLVQSGEVGINGGSEATVNFSPAFPNGTVTVLVSRKSGTTTTNTQYPCYVRSISASQVKIYNPNSSSNTVEWIAEWRG